MGKGVDSVGGDIPTPVFVGVFLQVGELITDPRACQDRKEIRNEANNQQFGVMAV